MKQTCASPTACCASLDLLLKQSVARPSVLQELTTAANRYHAAGIHMLLSGLLVALGADPDRLHHPQRPQEVPSQTIRLAPLQRLNFRLI